MGGRLDPVGRQRPRLLPRDDSQVAYLAAEKHYAEQPGVRIVLDRLVGLA